VGPKLPCSSQLPALVKPLWVPENLLYRPDFSRLGSFNIEEKEKKA
jgi:hypothetical protein